ncbi:MAG: hypothetical protein JW861_13375 [Bacteroidales bacterium]|nr:hypothetical protein [Bacteroidales bacterium]
MVWYHWIALLAVMVCLTGCIIHLVKLVRPGKPRDYSRPAGRVGTAILYSLSGAMNTTKKESAFLHLPTYKAGIIYHLGIFSAVPLFLILLSRSFHSAWWQWPLASLFAVTGLCGFGVWAKWIVKKELRSISIPDDYISNILVTSVQFMSAIVLLHPEWLPVYFLLTSALLIYIPTGKLRHAEFSLPQDISLDIFTDGVASGRLAGCNG